MEEMLPWSAEESLSSFQLLQHQGRHQLATICANYKETLALLETVANSGVLVTCVTPMCMVIAQYLVDVKKLPRLCRLLIDQGDDPSDLILLHNGQVASWQLVSDGVTLQRYVQTTTETDVPLLRVANPEHKSHFINSLFTRDIEFNRNDVVAFARRTVKGKSGVWFNLAKDPAAVAFADSEPVKLVERSVLAVTLLCIALGGAMMWRAHRVESSIDSVRQQQESLYQATFPNQRVPVALLARLRSEGEKARAAMGSDGVPTSQSAIPILRTIISAIPSDNPFKLLEADVSNGDIALDLELESHAAAGEVAQTLTSNGIQVSPPATSSLESGRVRAHFVGRQQVTPSRGNATVTEVSADG